MLKLQRREYRKRYGNGRCGPGLGNTLGPVFTVSGVGFPSNAGPCTHPNITSATYVPTHTTLAHNCHALVPFSILNRLAVFVFHGFPCLTHLAQYRLLVCFASSFAYIVNINILIKPNQISTLALEQRLRILVYLKSM